MNTCCIGLVAHFYWGLCSTIESGIDDFSFRLRGIECLRGVCLKYDGEVGLS